MLTERGVVSGTECEITDETDDGFDERPAARRMEQLDESWQAVVQTHGILGQLGLGMTRRQVTQSADGRLSDILAITGLNTRQTCHVRLQPVRAVQTCTDRYVH